MKKIHKRLLGVGGIAFIAAMTAVAYHIPDVGAVSTTHSGSVDINVNIISNNPEIIINTPEDGDQLTTANLHIVAQYSDADEVKYTLSNGTKTIEIPSPDLSGNATDITGNSGEHDFYYNLKEFNPSTAGYGDYTLRAIVTRNGSSVDNYVSFSYVPAKVDDGSIPTDKNNNPIVDLLVKPSVMKVEAIVLDQDGNEVFRTTADVNGQSPAYLTLPFSDHDSESGTYLVKFITYSYNGLDQLVADQDEETTNLKTLVTYEKKAEPEPEPEPEPVVPDTDCTTNPDPVIDITVEEGVEKVEIIVYDKNKNELFRFETPVASITTNHVTIPLSHYCLEDGDYFYGIIPYARNEDGELVPLITEDEAKRNAIAFTYGSPEVPNTGSFFESLNLSQKDFLLTGLIIFTVVAAGSIVILKKQESRR